jgi:hypothetical protein
VIISACAKTEEHHLSLPGHWDQGRAGKVCTTCFYQIQRYISPEIIIPIKEQKQRAKTIIFFQKKWQKRSNFPKKIRK